MHAYFITKVIDVFNTKAWSGLLTSHFALAFSPSKIGPERRYLLCTLHLALCISHFAFHTLHFAFHTLHFTLCASHFAFHTLHFVFVTLHFSLDTWYMCHSLMVFLICHITKCDRNGITIEILCHKVVMPTTHSVTHP